MNELKPKIWILDTWEPFFTSIVKGEKRIDVRRNFKLDVIKGDWLLFKAFDETGTKFLKKYTVKMIDYIILTTRVSFWEKRYEDDPTQDKWFIMQLVSPQCPECNHVVKYHYDEDEGLNVSYFSCGVTNCQCFCGEEIDYDCGNPEAF